MSLQFADPCNDLAFKKIFAAPGGETSLRSLLNALLVLEGPREIASLTIGNPYQAPLRIGLCNSLLFINVTDGRGVNYIVEMQIEDVESYASQFVYYQAKSYVGQIKRAEDYPKLNQVIFIGILDFKMFHDNPDYVSRHLIMDARTHVQTLDGMEFNFVELPKFRKKEQELATRLDDWLWYFKHARKSQEIPRRALADPGLRQSWETANQHAWSAAEMEEYDSCAMRVTGARMTQEKVDTLTVEVAEMRRQKKERHQKEKAEAAEAREKAATDRLERARLLMRSVGLDPDAD